MNSIKMAAIMSNVSGGTVRESHRPTETPSRLVAIRAKLAPSKTLNGEADWALISMVASWVLSPISAKKMVKKVESQTFPMLLRLSVADLSEVVTMGLSYLLYLLIFCMDYSLIYKQPIDPKYFYGVSDRTRTINLRTNRVLDFSEAVLSMW
jgi:hypothetical protein